MYQEEKCLSDSFRKPTLQESASVSEYVKKISVPTGVNFYDFLDISRQTRETPNIRYGVSHSNE